MKATIVILFITFVLGLVALIANVPTWIIIYTLAIIVLGIVGALIGELFYTVVFKKEGE